MKSKVCVARLCRIPTGLIRSLITGAMLAALALPAVAQQSPSAATPDPLQSICTGFLTQSGQGVSGDAAKLCTCLVRETKAQLSEQEMKSYSQAAQSGQAPPEAVLQKVMGIASACLAQAK